MYLDTEAYITLYDEDTQEVFAEGWLSEMRLEFDKIITFFREKYGRSLNNFDVNGFYLNADDEKEKTFGEDKGFYNVLEVFGQQRDHKYDYSNAKKKQDDDFWL